MAWRAVAIAHIATRSATRSEGGVREPETTEPMASSHAAIPRTANRRFLRPEGEPRPQVAVPTRTITTAAQRWLPPTSGAAQPSCDAAKTTTANAVVPVAAASFQVSISITSETKPRRVAAVAASWASAIRLRLFRSDHEGSGRCGRDGRRAGCGHEKELRSRVARQRFAACGGGAGGAFAGVGAGGAGG